MRISDWSSDVCSSDLHRRTELAVVQRRSEQLRACALRPGVPVTDEQLVEQHAGGFPRGECVEFLLAARDVALALGKYFERERYARAVGREVVVVDRKSVVLGKGVSVRVDVGGGCITNKTHNQNKAHNR